MDCSALLRFLYVGHWRNREAYRWTAVERTVGGMYHHPLAMWAGTVRTISVRSLIRHNEASRIWETMGVEAFEQHSQIAPPRAREMIVHIQPQRCRRSSSCIEREAPLLRPLQSISVSVLSHCAGLVLLRAVNFP